MRTPARYISRLGSITLPHTPLNLLKYWFFLQSIHTLSNQYSRTRSWGAKAELGPAPWPSREGVCAGSRDTGAIGRWEVPLPWQAAVSQTRADGWTAQRRRDKEGGTCFLNRRERLRKGLPLLFLQTKELKEAKSNFKAFLRLFLFWILQWQP